MYIHCHSPRTSAQYQYNPCNQTGCQPFPHFHILSILSFIIFHKHSPTKHPNKFKIQSSISKEPVNVTSCNNSPRRAKTAKPIMIQIHFVSGKFHRNKTPNGIQGTIFPSKFLRAITSGKSKIYI